MVKNNFTPSFLVFIRKCRLTTTVLYVGLICVNIAIELRKFVGIVNEVIFQDVISFALF